MTQNRKNVTLKLLHLVLLVLTTLRPCWRPLLYMAHLGVIPCHSVSVILLRSSISQHQAKAVICCLISSNSWFNFWILGLCTAEDTEGKIDYGHLWGWNHLISSFILLQERQTSQKTPWMWHFFWRDCFLLSLTPMLHGWPTCGRKFNFSLASSLSKL